MRVLGLLLFLLATACDDDAEEACDRIIDLAEEDAIFLDPDLCEQDMAEELPSCVQRDRFLECLEEVPSYRGARLCKERLCN
jgi:hypothetical protein